jgi:hypothetical protein
LLSDLDAGKRTFPLKTVAGNMDSI